MAFDHRLRLDGAKHGACPIALQHHEFLSDLVVATLAHDKLLLWRLLTLLGSHHRRVRLSRREDRRLHGLDRRLVLSW